MECVGAGGHGVCNGSCELGICWASDNEDYAGEKTPRLVIYARL
jgi:hypothetical protein